MVIPFFRQAKAENNERRSNQGFTFLVVNGQGVTILDVNDYIQEIQLHTPHPGNLENWFRQAKRSFNGLLLLPNSSFREYHPAPGKSVLIYNLEADSYSQLLWVEGVFHTRNISSKVKPEIFVPYIGDADNLDVICNITSDDEQRPITELIQNIFTRAMESNSWTVSVEEVEGCAGYFQHEIFFSYLSTLIDSGLINYDGVNITIQDNLVYMMMHTINVIFDGEEPRFQF